MMAKTMTNPVAITADHDRAIIARFLEGDEAAFTLLVNQYRRLVYAVTYRFTGNHEEADDLTQETFIKAYRKLKKFRGEAAFKTWLLRIATNLSINYTKSGRVTKDAGQRPEDLDPAHEPDGLEPMIESERKRQLRAAIYQLPPKQQQTLLLKTYQNMTCEEVATIMACSVGTVKANLFNATKNLRRILESGAVS